MGRVLELEDTTKFRVLGLSVLLSGDASEVGFVSSSDPIALLVRVQVLKNKIDTPPWHSEVTEPNGPITTAGKGFKA